MRRFPRSLLSKGGAWAVLLLLIGVMLFAVDHETVQGPEPTAATVSSRFEETEGTEARLAAELESLRELGYVQWVEVDPEDRGRVGVVAHDAARTSPGAHLFKSRTRHSAHLLDLEGRVLHTWRAADRSGEGWQVLEVDSAGELFAAAELGPLEKYDWDSNLLWRLEIHAHHDADIAGDPNGRVITLTQEIREIDFGRERLPIVDNGIAIVSAAGDLIRQVFLSRMFAERISADRIQGIRTYLEEHSTVHIGTGGAPDVFHCNSVELLTRDVPGVGNRGDALISIRELDLIAVVDLEDARVVWSWGPGALDRPHHPSLLDDDRVLVFDNGTNRGFSRVLEVDPQSGRIVWEFRGDPPESFFSRTRGSAQRFTNGNTLIVESDRGHVFEVDRAGEIVWEFFNPDLKENGRHRAAIYRMPRLHPDFVAELPWQE